MYVAACVQPSLWQYQGRGTSSPTLLTQSAGLQCLQYMMKAIITTHEVQAAGLKTGCCVKQNEACSKPLQSYMTHPGQTSPAKQKCQASLKW